MIIIPNKNNGDSSITKDEIKLSDIKLDIKGIKDLDERIGYGHNHTSDQVIFPKLDWTDKYILGDIITELHKENVELKASIENLKKLISK